MKYRLVRLNGITKIFRSGFDNVIKFEDIVCDIVKQEFDLSQSNTEVKCEYDQDMHVSGYTVYYNGFSLNIDDFQPSTITSENEFIEYISYIKECVVKMKESMSDDFDIEVVV